MKSEIISMSIGFSTLWIVFNWMVSIISISRAKGFRKAKDSDKTIWIKTVSWTIVLIGFYSLTRSIYPDNGHLALYGGLAFVMWLVAPSY